MVIVRFQHHVVRWPRLIFRAFVEMVSDIPICAPLALILEKLATCSIAVPFETIFKLASI
jgi:hypothetical protein